MEGVIVMHMIPIFLKVVVVVVVIHFPVPALASGSVSIYKSISLFLLPYVNQVYIRKNFKQHYLLINNL